MLKMPNLKTLGDLSDYKLHAARRANGEESLDLFYKAPQRLIDWSAWGGACNIYGHRPFIFTMAHIYDEEYCDLFLFAGILRVIETLQNSDGRYHYKLEETTIWKEFIDVLRIKFHAERRKDYYLEKEVNSGTFRLII